MYYCGYPNGKEDNHDLRHKSILFSYAFDKYRVSTKKLPSLFFDNISIKSSPNSKSKVSFEVFKTVLDFQFWPSRSWDIRVRTYQQLLICKIFWIFMKRKQKIWWDSEEFSLLSVTSEQCLVSLLFLSLWSWKLYTGCSEVTEFL